MLTATDTRIGFHRVSTDVTTAEWFPQGDVLLDHVSRLILDPDVDKVWARDHAGQVNYLKGMGRQVTTTTTITWFDSDGDLVTTEFVGDCIVAVRQWADMHDDGSAIGIQSTMTWARYTD